MTNIQTLQEAKQHLRANWDKGVDCPCCGQFVKRYTYHLNASIGATLISLYKLHEIGSEWIHVNTEIRPESGGYFSLAKHWGLIEQREKDDHERDAKRVSGYWKLTPKGNEFVRGIISVPKSVYCFDGKVLGFSEAQVNIHKALGKKFNYQELMNS